MAYGLTMRPEEKERWINALESGQFTQGLTKLKQKYGGSKQIKHCCLGVFCDIQEVKQRESAYTFYFQFNSINEADNLPNISWFGQFFDFTPTSKVKNKEVAIDKLNNKLAKMNDGTDGTRYSFKEIASWIRRYL